MIALPEGSIDSYIALDGSDAKNVVLRPAGEEAELIFGDANPVQSEALMRLDIAGAAGMFVFGSGDPKKFDSSYGTDLLNFFAGVVERLLLQRLADDND